MSGEGGVSVNKAISRKLQVLLSMRGTEGVEVMENVLGEGEGEDNLDELLVGHVIDFLEAFVENAADRDKGNKETLKDVLGVMTGKGKGGKVTEEEVDEWMENNRGRFDACFLKHLDGEVRRVKKAKSTNPQNARTVEILNIIRVRVVEEAGRGLGEDAVVLEQVMSYESEEVRTKVILAGLEARGMGFAEGIKGCADEAEGEIEVVERGGGEVEEEFKSRLREVKETVKRWIELGMGGEDGEWE